MAFAPEIKTPNETLAVLADSNGGKRREIAGGTAPPKLSNAATKPAFTRLKLPRSSLIRLWLSVMVAPTVIPSSLVDFVVTVFKARVAVLDGVFEYRLNSVIRLFSRYSNTPSS